MGRGPLAGPVVAACVVIEPRLITENPPGYFSEIDDSKKLTPSKREELSRLLHEQEGVQIGIGVIDSFVIDKINILEAALGAMKCALERLDPPPDHCLVDGIQTIPGLDIPQTALVKGDSRSLSIGAASIIAKVFRDHLMEEYDREFPRYGFARHKGYGTPEHLESLRKFGPCVLHRKSFAPVSTIDGVELS